jgi:histidinol phosphatase-like enzyme (inositol monophosphatase family)
LTASLLLFIHRLADTSGEIIRRYFRADLAIDYKNPDQPVTRADRETEKALREIIARERPEDGFFGEETGAAESRNGYTWTIDPIDGTKAFACGKPIFGTLIALLQNDTPILGLIDQPILRERWLGVAGERSTMNGAAIHTSKVTALASARLGTTGPRLFTPDELAAFNRVGSACGIVTYGGDCYNYGLLAMGGLDLVIESNLKLYDYAALIPVIEGAGGIVTGWAGEVPGRVHDGRIIAAANRDIHQAALALLAKSA